VRGSPDHLANHERLLRVRIVWTRTGDKRFPYRAEHGTMKLKLYSGDWPTENPYTLYIDGAPAFGIGDIPSSWVIPE
jgi:hypothetical protein